uniref:CCHC-type domain-containing protein n=2 Tax=Photinus pyralis TaxID=7054 RepID=A0A1Y1ML49_PHOPY
MFGRVLKSSIANDNGRSVEFIRRKNYPDKSFCYECGETGHLSYKCDRNLLGERNPPPKKVRKKKAKEKVAEEEEDEIDNDDDCETLSVAIAMEQTKYESLDDKKIEVVPRKRIKRSNYFSDEEESD